MSAGGASKKSIQVKYKKISFKDLEFDQGDDFFERGQFGDVKRARWNSKVVAVKCFTSADRKGGFSEELVCLSLLQSHEHIVEMHGASVSDHPFIVLEFAPMSLEKVLHDKGKKQYRYHAEHVMSWSRQIALALEYIHSKDMLHRDIKPSNVLLFKDGLLLKLCDFGTAKKLEHTLTNAVGTIRYMAPEVIRGRYYTASCDAFSFGIVVWEMITRKRPTLGAGKGQHSNMAILYAMANGQRPPKIANIPKALQEMITKCWDNEPQSRPTMTEIREKLEKLCEYVDDARPLISKRQQKKKEEPTQGDIFASSRSSTQHENTDYKKDTAKEEGSGSRGSGEGGAKSLGSVQGGGEDRRESDGLVSASPASKADEPPPVPPHPTRPPQETSEQFRDRAVTLPGPHRLNDHTGRRGPSNMGIPTTDLTGGGQEQIQRQQYTKQISSPEMSHQSQVSSKFHSHVQHSSSISPSFTGSPSNDFRYPPQFSHPGRQRSEYGNFQTELSVSSTEHVLREQSERFANYESEAMKKKETPHGPFTSATASPHYIPGLDPDLQPVFPVEDNAESKELYRQYRIVAEQIMRAKKEYENLLEESANLDKELKYDRQKLEANRGLTQEHQRLLAQRERLVAELQEHQEKLSKLMVQNDQFNNN